jgi:hypothetical protein
MTVIIVPSTGVATARVACWTARRTDSPNDRVVRCDSVPISLLMPWMNWAKIRPELPRAPPRAALAMDLSVVLIERWAWAPSAMARIVVARLVPVSASGTGKTLILLR